MRGSVLGRTRGAAAILLWAAACGIPEEGPAMLPGQDCMQCHSATATGERGRTWTAAGTVFAAADASAQQGLQGAQVRITDRSGRRLVLDSNLAGNFYTAEPLSFPLQVEVARGDVVRRMSMAVATGACNSCHTVPGVGGAPGRIFVAP